MKLFGIIPRNEVSTVEVPQTPRSRSDASAPSDKNSVQGRALSQIRCKCVLFRLAGAQWIAWSRRVVGGLRKRERAGAPSRHPDQSLCPRQRATRASTRQKPVGLQLMNLGV